MGPLSNAMNSQVANLWAEMLPGVGELVPRGGLPYNERSGMYYEIDQVAQSVEVEWCVTECGTNNHFHFAFWVSRKTVCWDVYKFYRLDRPLGDSFKWHYNLGLSGGRKCETFLTSRVDLS